MKVLTAVVNPVMGLITRLPVLVRGAAVVALLASPNLAAQLTMDRLDSSNRADNSIQSKMDPFRVIDNVWWVGNSEIGAILITTPDGHVLIDTLSTHHAPWTVENIVKAGFELQDIKYILNTHTHEEHMGGTAMFKKLIPDAELVVTKESADVMATGGKTDFRYMSERDETDLFEPVLADRLIRHMDQIRIGGETLTAHVTPGHTEGGTTWTFEVEDGGQTYTTVIFSGMSASGIDRAPILNNEDYPEIKQDYESSFAHLKQLDCDVYLYPRASSIKLHEKLERREQGDNRLNVFVDPEGCQHYINYYELRYQDQLQEEQEMAGPAGSM